MATSKSTSFADITPGSDTLTTTLRLGLLPSGSLTVTEWAGTHSTFPPSTERSSQEATCSELISSIRGLDLLSFSADETSEGDSFVVLSDFKMSGGRGEESVGSISLVHEFKAIVHVCVGLTIHVIQTVLEFTDRQTV